ncbi:hypothetical protein Tco_0425750 [Tanacetum coccineum]
MTAGISGRIFDYIAAGGVRTLEVHNEKERIASFSTLLVETKLYPWFKCVPCSSKDQERYSGDSVAKNKHVKLHDNEVLLLLTCRLRLCNYPIVASGKAFNFIQRARAVRVNEGVFFAVCRSYSELIMAKGGITKSVVNDRNLCRRSIHTKNGSSSYCKPMGEWF